MIDIQSLSSGKSSAPGSLNAFQFSGWLTFYILLVNVLVVFVLQNIIRAILVHAVMDGSKIRSPLPPFINSFQRLLLILKAVFCRTYTNRKSESQYGQSSLTIEKQSAAVAGSFSY